MREEGRLEPAISHYEQALRLKPDWPEVHNNFAIALQEQGRTAEAVEHYERALSLNSGLAEVHQNLGSALAQSGRTVDAVAALRRAPYTCSIRPTLRGSRAESAGSVWFRTLS